MKYWQPKGSGVHLYILPTVRAVLSNPDIEIAITEGEKKPHASLNAASRQSE